ncbi:TonB-dependent receptor [Psychroflexus planctonicus]|uniref:Membrane protein n=1 Tax=Psychroflexus planctonicus TaxID=1526575 RepID=A0ABQ1SCR1_9FLAO|nr:TonB-dependent receptor [Psychroflexus planctonicus]GGE28768.1 membrane protein [Psychroflexus planctonicus]
MKYIFLVSLFWLSILHINAQECTLSLSGKVIDIHDNSPLTFAIVEIKETGQFAEADSNGEYQISKICPGNYTIKVSHVSCEKLVEEIQMNSSQEIDFKLEHHIDELSEVLLTGRIYQNTNNTSISKELDKARIDRYSNLSFGEALAEINGVSSLNTGASINKPIIQGMHSSRIIMINNNVRMFDQQWGVDHAPNIDVNSAANIEVIKGASALRYGGDAVGGIIVSTPQKAPLKDTLFGKSIANFNSNGLGGGITASLLKANKNGWYIKTQASAKRRGDLEAPNYNLSNTGVQENNFSIGFGLNKIESGFNVYYSLFSTEIGILRASHIGNVRDLVNSINNSTPSFIEDFSYQINSPKQEVKHQLAKFDYFKKIDNLGKLEFQYAFQFNQRQEFDVRRGSNRNKAALDLELATHHFLSQLKIDKFKNFNLNVGIESTYQDHFANPETGVRRLIPDYEMFALGSFITANHQLNEQILLDAGLRYDYTYVDALKFYRTSRWEERNYQNDFSDIIIEDFGTQLLTNPKFHYHNFSSSLGLQYQVNKASKLIGNLSLATRNPNPSELFSDGLHHSIASIELGDLRLQQEQSYKLNVSYEQEIQNFSFEINPYFNLIENFMTLEPNEIETTIRGAFPVFAYRQTRARFMGVDVEATYQFNSNSTLVGQLAYVQADDLSLNRPIIDMPPFNTRLQLNQQIESWNQLNLQFTHEFVAKQNRFPNLDFTTPVLDPEIGELVATEVGISAPPSAYQLFHFGAEMPFQFKHLDLRVAFNVHNIFNTSYRNYLNRQRYYADEIGRNFQLQIQFNF